MIYVRELQPGDAPAIAAIETARHGALADGAERHRQYMAEAIAESVNLSFGLFDGGKLVGYLLCYGFSPTSFPGETGEALYIEDIAMLPRYRRHVAQVIRRFGAEARAHFPGSTVEAHSVESVFRLWRDHPAFFADGGYAITRHLDTGEQINGEARFLIRWQPLPEWTAPAPTPEEMLARLPGHPIRVDGREFVAKVVEDLREWQALEPVWDRLLARLPERTVFQSYDYQRLWWRHFGGDNELFIVVLLRDGEIAGIAPLQVQPVRLYGRYFRLLGFIGSRWEVDRPKLFFGDDATLTRALVRFLASRTEKWDLCSLHEQPTDSAGLDALTEAFAAEGCLLATTRDSDCAYLAIEGTWQQFLAGKSQTFRKNLKAAGRRLRAAGEVEYRVYDSLPEVLEQLELYRDIEARSWKSDEGVGVGRDEDYFDFYREMAQVFGRRGGFVIRMLRVGDKLVAGTFGLLHDGIFYSLQIAHDRDFSRASPGTYLEGLEMEQCFAQGLREYEFLGGFLNNKSRWTSTFRYTTQVHVYRRTPFFLALHTLLFRIKPRVKELVRPYMRSWRKPEPAGAAADD
jgi:CelD/BcsL family acetyltransferase involved in cellulose biosynthesis